MAAAVTDIKPDTDELHPLSRYDVIIVEYSGGKDSLACLLYVIELMRAADIPLDRLEVWHHCIDGAPGDEPGLMDWPCTLAYVRATCEALGVRLRLQWRDGGFERELFKEQGRTAPVTFELRDGSLRSRGGVTGKVATQRRWPAKSANLTNRWCSGTLKIDVDAIAIRGDEFFDGKRILEVTGERREESANRARYATVERHRTDCSIRRCTVWRPVLGWSEAAVWDIIRRWRVRPHPAYELAGGASRA